MVLKIVDSCSFRRASRSTEEWVEQLGCLRLFYCIQIMDGLISGEGDSGGERRGEGVSLSIQMCIVNERINDGNLKRLRS
jgi:hypothetical protein